ncbi:hypothetical protein [Brevundimonas naejangsanensis]|uniref:hypothetical protein n=1 Tax=Brevundimonas naejangsanensis TaxID=588932 RepID=UPI00106D709C|nr:hypothetical protein [Brevundimonas naejangsanensis]QBQ47595.1 hypothetical protein E3U41_02210 [Brevundimonas naejangsanensis]
MIGRGALLGALGALFASTAWAQAPAPTLDQDALIAQAERVERHADALSRLWPGYWPKDQPFILYAPDIGAVFGGARRPGTPRFRPGRLEGAEFHFVLDYPSGVPDTVLLRPDGADDDLSTLFHEQFHDFQNTAFRWMSGDGHQEFVDLDAIPDLAGFIAALDLERLVLQAALLEPDAPARKHLAQTYLALRTARSADLPAEVLAVQQQREWSEGTAEFIGLQASHLIAGRPDAALSSAIARALATPSQNDMSLVSELFRWRAYPVGAALTWLLADVGADQWRTQVGQGAPLDVLLRQTIGEGSVEDVSAVAARFNLAALKAQAIERLAHAPAGVTTREAFLDQAPHWLVLELKSPVDRGKEIQLSFSAAEMTPLADGAIALPHGMVVMEAPGLTLKSERSPALIEAPVGVVANGVIAHAVTLPLAAVDLHALRAGEPFLLEKEGLSLRIDAPDEIQQQAGRTRISLTLPKEP